MKRSVRAFDPIEHESQIVPLIESILDATGREARFGSVVADPGSSASARLDDREYQRLVRQHPRLGGGAYSKSEIIRAYRRFAERYGWTDEAGFVSRVRMKPVRTLSGVAPVTVLTRPHPCPGKCIFCPNDVRMPKSYLSREPGAQRAAQHHFDPYGQTLGRLLTYHHNGHRIDKIEMIVLGGTWSFYPEPYQVWFVKRCFDAMNEFRSSLADQLPERVRGPLDFDGIEKEVDGRTMAESYNRVVADHLAPQIGRNLLDDEETATWAELEEAHRRNETAEARCVGLVVETRPDHLDDAEVERIRRLGCTKVQIGFQSLDDRVLEANARGHDVAATRRAVSRLRAAGFKLHAHWMPNLHGSDPQNDIVDFARLFDDPDFRPDELKIYPCSLIETAELMAYYEAGTWRPYTEQELSRVLCESLVRVPEYCRVTRVIRDIPGDDIYEGNKVTNFREVVERQLAERGLRSRDIRAREIRGRAIDAETLRLVPIRYRTSVGEEIFLQLVTGREPDDYLVGFLRLSLPDRPVTLAEIRTSAMIREVHVYGGVVAIGGSAGEGGAGRSQHLGAGTRLVEEAARLASDAGFDDLAVISAIGTRGYYRRLGFADGELYQHRPLGAGKRVEAARVGQHHASVTKP